VGIHRITSRRLPVGPEPQTTITISVEGDAVEGLLGQTLAGVMLAAGASAWGGAPSGDRQDSVFCGIGICFNCLVTVNGLRDVRACQRRAVSGDSVVFQQDLLVDLDQRDGNVPR
jgi:hypothetical protein